MLEARASARCDGGERDRAKSSGKRRKECEDHVGASFLPWGNSSRIAINVLAQAASTTSSGSSGSPVGLSDPVADLLSQSVGRRGPTVTSLCQALASDGLAPETRRELTARLAQQREYHMREWEHRQAKDAAKKATSARLAYVEGNLLTYGYVKLSLAELHPSLTLSRFSEALETLSDARYMTLFQDLGSGRYKSPRGDNRRQQAFLGDRRFSAEVQLVEALQELHDWIFNVQERQDSFDVHAAVESASLVSKAAADQSSSSGVGTRAQARRKSADDLPEGIRWTRHQRFGRTIHEVDPMLQHRNRRCTVVSALKSQPGCGRQCEHFDWIPVEGFGTLGILSMLLPCTHPSRLHVWPHSHWALEAQVQEPGREASSLSEVDHDPMWNKAPSNEVEVLKAIGSMTPVDVTVELGEVLLFLGHVLHAGADWGGFETKDNVRLHTYFLPASMEFPQQVRTVVPPDWIRRRLRWPSV